MAVSATTTDLSCLIGKGSGGDVDGWNMRVNTNNLTFRFAQTEITGSAINDGILHLCSVLRNGADVGLFIDAVEVASTSADRNLSGTAIFQMMASNNANPCKGNLYKVLIGTRNVSIASAVNDMLALYAQGAYK